MKTSQPSQLLNLQSDWMTYGFSTLRRDLPDNNNMARNSGMDRDWKSTDIALANRQQFRRSLWLPDEPLVTMSSQHSSNVTLVVNHNGPEVVMGDALITNQPGLVLQGLFADCCQVILADQRHQAIGLAHAGWTGTMQGVLRQTLLSMKDKFGTNPRDVAVYFGPTICANHLPRSNNREEHALIETFAFTTGAMPVTEVRDDKLHCDIVATNINLLKLLGVEQIEASGICTFENEDQPSARRDDPRLGGPFRANAIAVAMILP